MTATPLPSTDANATDTITTDTIAVRGAHQNNLKHLDVDIPLLPVSGTYVMTADEAVAAALAINPGVTVPMHYGAIVGDSSDADAFKAKLEGKVDVRIL